MSSQIDSAAERWLELIEHERKWLELLCHCDLNQFLVFPIGGQFEPHERLKRCVVVRIMLSDRNRQCRN